MLVALKNASGKQSKFELALVVPDGCDLIFHYSTASATGPQADFACCLLLTEPGLERSKTYMQIVTCSIDALRERCQSLGLGHDVCFTDILEMPAVKRASAEEAAQANRAKVKADKKEARLSARLATTARPDVETLTAAFIASAKNGAIEIKRVGLALATLPHAADEIVGYGRPRFQFGEVLNARSPEGLKEINTLLQLRKLGPLSEKQISYGQHYGFRDPTTTDLIVSLSTTSFHVKTREDLEGTPGTPSGKKKKQPATQARCSRCLLISITFTRRSPVHVVVAPSPQPQPPA